MVERELRTEVCTGRRFSELLINYADWFASIPDSVFKTTYPHLPNLRIPSRENHAVGEAFAASLAGRSPCVLMQNSGLGLSLDALIGLFHLYQRGLMLVVSNRGELDWEEVQHQFWGEITEDLLNLLPVTVFDLEELGEAAIRKAAETAFIGDEIAVVVVHRGNLSESS